MIKAVIFDFGGVIKKSSTSSVRDIAAVYGISKKILFQKMRRFLELFRKGLISENQFWKELSSDLNKPMPKNKNYLWRRRYEKSYYIYPSILNFAKKLKAKGIKTAILSNTISPHVEIISKKGGYKGFDVVVLSCNEGLQKPESEIYFLTVKKLNIKPKDCIFIDNKKQNLRPAKKLGMQTVLATNPRQIINEVSKIIDSLKRF